MIIEDASQIAAITSVPGNSQAAFVGAMLSAVGAAITSCQNSCTFTISGDGATDANYQSVLNDRGYSVTNNGNGTLTLTWSGNNK